MSFINFYHNQPLALFKCFDFKVVNLVQLRYREEREREGGRSGMEEREGGRRGEKNREKRGRGKGGMKFKVIIRLYANRLF